MISRQLSLFCALCITLMLLALSCSDNEKKAFCFGYDDPRFDASDSRVCSPVSQEELKIRNKNRRRCCASSPDQADARMHPFAWQSNILPDPDLPPGGIALSFDDTFIESWYQARELFNAFDARATFFITRFQNLSPSQLRMLRQLQDDGHEIAAHGIDHRNASNFVREHGLETYLQVEVLPLIEKMKDAGFSPTSWAYPQNARTEEIDQALLRHFSVVRHGGYSTRWNVLDCECAYYRWNGERSLYAVGIDAYANVPKEQLFEAVARAGHFNEVLLLYAHDILQEVNDRDMAISYARLRELIEFASGRGLTFYTFSELRQDE